MALTMALGMIVLLALSHSIVQQTQTVTHINNLDLIEKTMLPVDNAINGILTHFPYAHATNDTLNCIIFHRPERENILEYGSVSAQTATDTSSLKAQKYKQVVLRKRPHESTGRYRLEVGVSETLLPSNEVSNLIVTYPITGYIFEDLSFDSTTTDNTHVNTHIMTLKFHNGSEIYYYIPATKPL